MEEQFQVILQHMKGDSLHAVQRELAEFGVDNSTSNLDIVEIENSLAIAPVTIASGLSGASAQSFKNRLEAVGASVLIVKANTLLERPATGLPVVPFSSVFQSYKQRLLASLHAIDPQQVAMLGEACLSARSEGKQIIIFGNGGSGANASHFANDFSKHGHDDEKLSFRVISLTDNVSWMTAIANDFGYENVFAQQLRNLLQPDDVVIAISSSGNSANIINAVEYANKKGAHSFGMAGFGGGKLAEVAHNTILVPSVKGDYGVMEDGCLVIGHMLSEFFASNRHL